ncbi:MAG TPA: hypothetical protein VK208_09840, partial [Pyrinomonadaceae bacterium]|nr:hypothetical protein [Pyrinomonadaceae bacterium]
MKDPRLIRTYKTTTVFGLILLLLGFALLAAPSDRIQTAAHSKSQGALGESNSYASLSLEQISELKNLSQQLADGQPFSAEEKIILRRFVAGEQISELEGDVVIKRVLFNYFVANGYLNAEDLALLKKYNAYCLSERRFNEDARLQAKRENSERQNATQPEPGLQPAAIPANDTCAGAISIVDTGTYPITTLTVDAVDATTTGDPTFCAAVSGLDDTIWYTFVPAVTGTYNITTCPTVAPGTSTSDTILGIFTSSGSCGGPFTSVDCNDDDIDCNNNASTISPILTAGLTYYIVAGRSTFLVEPSSVPIQLAISRVPAPANDTCASATPLTLNTPAIGQATAAANNDYQLSGTTCFTALGDNSIGNTNSTAVGRDVAYSFTAPSAGSYSFRISKFGNTLDPVLYLTTSCPSGPAPITVTCSNTTGPAIAAAHRVNGTGAQEIPCVSLSSGQTVYLIVDEASITVGSSAFTVEVNSCTQETEPNDTPATAGTGTEGVISSSSDVDFYQLGAPSAGSRVFAMVDGLAANSTDFDMRVTTSTDTLEFDSQDADSQFGSLSPVISGTLLTGVNSFLRISHGAATTATGPYRLYSKIQPGGTSDTPNCGGTQSSATAESEPNNTSAQANSAGNNYFYGTIPTPAPATDVDYYSFTANTGDLIFLGLDGDPCLGSAMNAALDLRDSADALLIGVNDGNGTNCGASCTPTAGNLAATT